VVLAEQLLKLDDDEVGFWRSLVAGSLRLVTGMSAISTWEKLLAGRFVQVESVRTETAMFLLLRAVAPEAARPLDTLELTMLEGVAAGKAGKVIAVENDMSDAMASARLKSCLKRLGLRSRAELQWFCRESGTLTPPSTLAVVTRRFSGAEIAILRYSRCAGSVGVPFPKEEGAVVAGVLAGMTNREIARERGASAHTVKNQIANAMSRVNACSRFDLIAKSAGWAPAATVPDRLPASVAHEFLRRLDSERP
jgi:DNA-binding NarL/FixJ family response regulator